MTLAINLSHIDKSFKNKQVLKDVNLQIESGEIIGLMGANGAGKSTLIKIMTGLIKPDQGEINIFDQSLTNRNTRKFLSIAPQLLATYPQLSVKQNLKYFGAINGLSKNEITQKYKTLIESFGLKSIENQRSEVLSGGQNRRLHSAIALMSNAKIIFLDEPTVGADIDSRNSIIQAVKNLAQQHQTIIYTTHYLQEMEDLNARILFLNHGNIQASGSVDQLIKQYAHPSLRLEFKEKILNKIPGWQSENARTILSINNENQNNAQLLQQILNMPEINQKHLVDIKTTKANLESAYRTLLKEEKSCN